MSAYADISFLAALYAPDSNSLEAASRMERAPLPIFLTPLGELEPINALQLRLFRGEFRLPEVRAAYRAFRADLRNGILTMKPLLELIYAHAMRIAPRWTAKLGIRALDILHVASALALEVEIFQTFDDRQRKLARAMGLKAR